MAGRCLEHHIALSPEGTCVLCRREEAPPPAKLSAPIVPVAITVVILAFCAVGLFFGVQFMLTGLGDAMSSLDETPMDREPAPGIIPPGGEVTVEQERWPEGPLVPQSPELMAARQRVQVTMYSTSWCGYCRRARAYMDEHGIRYEDHDIERDRAAASRMERINPRGGVPTFDIDGEPMVGFNEMGLESAIDRAAARRM